MKQLLSKARSRVIGHLVLDKGALALTIGLGAFLLLLLIGTQVLDWYWPVLIGAISLGIGVYQLRRNIPSTYEVAQRIDHKLALADSLSTAVYFSEHPKPGFEAVCAAQYRAAEQLAVGVNLPQALPLPRSRYLLPAAALLLAAAGLFGVRYFMIGSLDLQSSLLEAVADTFFSSQPDEIAKNTRKDLKKGAFDPSKPALPESPQDEEAPPPEFEKGDNPTFGKENQQKESSGDEKGQGKSDEQNSNEEQGDQSSSPQDKQGDKGREGKDNKESASQGNEQRSLMDKIRDAMNNVMNKMSSNDGKQAQKGNDKQKGQKQDKSGKSDDSQNSDDAQADNQNSNNGKQADAKQSANAPGQKPSDQAANGSGENDGKKAIEEAKMLEAMGKLNELIGERSNQITGDMTVEVGSSSQQLKTAMTQQKAGHTDAGGEIHRDQVPLADQLFVERYFKEVRKSGTSGTSKGKPAAPKQ